MRPKPTTARGFMERYPRITAHIISESLGYAPPTRAAQIGVDAVWGRDNGCEWIYSCYDRDARKALIQAIERRHYHTGYMAWYKELALPLVIRAIETKREPELASWF
jgi:hypothetical protein